MGKPPRLNGNLMLLLVAVVAEQLSSTEWHVLSTLKRHFIQNQEKPR